MSRPIVLSALLFGAALTVLAGCGKPAEKAAEPVEATPMVGAVPPDLWTIEVLGDDGAATTTVNICADDKVQEGFSRPSPEVNGQACVRVGEAVETDGTYSVRCRIDDQLYRVGASVEGDKSAEFPVNMAVTRQEKKGPSFEQTRRYRKVGPCPVGWENGDSAPTADATSVTTLTGETRTLAPAAE